MTPNTAMALFATYAIVLRTSKSGWIYPGQAATQRLLAKHHAIKIAQRTIRYHNLNQTNQGLVRRKRRYKRRSDGTVYILTTALCYTIQGYKILLSLGYTWAKEKIAWLRQKYGNSLKPELNKQPVPVPNPHEESPTKHGPNPFRDPPFRNKIGLKPHFLKS